MSLPRVIINLKNGQLGTSDATDDGVSGFVFTGATTSGYPALDVPVKLTTPRDLETLGITSANNQLAYDEVNAFFAKTGEGAEMWMLLTSNGAAASVNFLTSLLTVNGTANVFRKLLDAANGRIRLLGFNRTVPAEYSVAAITDKVAADVLTAIDAAQTLCAEYAAKFAPVRMLIPGFGLNITGATSFCADNIMGSGLTRNRVGVVTSADAVYSFTKSSATYYYGKANIGASIGRLASIQVHQNIGRVKDGSMATTAYFSEIVSTAATQPKTAENYSSNFGTVHDNGYIFLRTYPGKSGYYFNFDHTASQATDDYHQFSSGRVIDKALYLAYLTYVDELLDNIDVDDSGKIAPGVCMYLQKRIDNSVNTQMSGQISKFQSYINPAQNVLSTGQTVIACKITPKATQKEIVVELGFTNPATS